MAKKSDFLRQLEYKYKQADAFYNKHKNLQYKKYVAYWDGEQEAAIENTFGTEVDKIIMNICFARVETLVPNIISRNMQVIIKADSEVSKKLRKLVFDEVRKDLTYIQYYYSARDYAILGESYIKTYWATEFDGEYLERDENIVKRIDPRKMRVDKDSQNFFDSKYFCEEHTMTKAEIEKKYPKADTKDMTFGYSEDEEGDFKGSDFAKKAKVFEQYYVEGGKWYRCATDSSFKVELEKIESPEKRGHPYSYAANHKHPFMLKPQGEIAPIIKLQDFVNQTLTMQSKTLKTGQPKTLVTKGAFTADQVDTLQNSDTNDVLVVDDASGMKDIGMRYAAQPFTSTVDFILSIIQIVTGASPLQLGGGAKSNVTARSDMLADARFEGREGQKREDIEQLVTDSVYRMVDNFQTKLTETKVVEIDGERTEIEQHDLQMEYAPEIVVKINTVGKVVKQAERDNLMTLLQSMIQSGAFPAEELRKAFREIVRTYDEFEGLDTMIEELEVVEMPEPQEGQIQGGQPIPQGMPPIDNNSQPAVSPTGLPSL